MKENCCLKDSFMKLSPKEREDFLNWLTNCESDDCCENDVQSFSLNVAVSCDNKEIEEAFKPYLKEALEKFASENKLGFRGVVEDVRDNGDEPDEQVNGTDDYDISAHDSFNIKDSHDTFLLQEIVAIAKLIDGICDRSDVDLVDEIFKHRIRNFRK